ncbi:hypothetical protein R1sor_000553 [Riccia sorocarpa]|uniref:serine O-acetyltransferase n=1 Tax=Riccia sorocarpa TaxID=122646 RepID=A0ABD3GVD4_9MARC
MRRNSYRIKPKVDSWWRSRDSNGTPSRQFVYRRCKGILVGLNSQVPLLLRRRGKEGRKTTEVHELTATSEFGKVFSMSKLFETSGATLSSFGSFSTALSILSLPEAAAARVSTTATPQLSSNVGSSVLVCSCSAAWGKKKTRKSRSADLTVPASLLMEERTASNDHALNIIRENFRSAFEHRLSDSAAGGAMEVPISTSRVPPYHEDDPIWREMRAECRSDSEQEPALASYLYSTILAHKTLERALSFHLGNKLASVTFLSTQLVTLINETIMEDEWIRHAIREDIMAVRKKDPACVSYSHCLLNFKGFLALQAHRVAHRLWSTGRESLALAIQSRVSEVFHVDIHPAARIGRGILFDHATGVVVGETAVIGNNVSVLHHVTLGGTGAVGGDRHPKIGDGVLIGAGATILGPIRVGEGAKIGAGSVVLNDVPPHTTAVGNPARLVGGKGKPAEMKDIPSDTMDHTSFINNWSDYVI